MGQVRGKVARGLIALVIVMVLFPPFVSECGRALKASAGYAFLLSPPAHACLDTEFARVDWQVLGMQLLAVGLVTGLLFGRIRQNSEA